MTGQLSGALSPDILPSGAHLGHADGEGAEHPDLGGK